MSWKSPSNCVSVIRMSSPASLTSPVWLSGLRNSSSEVSVKVWTDQTSGAPMRPRIRSSALSARPGATRSSAPTRPEPPPATSTRMRAGAGFEPEVQRSLCAPQTSTIASA